MKTIAFLHFLFCTAILDAQEVSILPKPVSVIFGKGAFSISPSTQIKLEGSNMARCVNFFNDYLQKYYGFKLNLTQGSPKSNCIVLNFERMDYPIPGGYSLEVSDHEIYIAGDNEEGVFYGIQSLIQLLPVIPAKVLSISSLTITDHPRFAWRGLHLDVGRHFFSVDEIKNYIDFIALHKMNYFHWHLTEDQGWRIEIKKYPLLTQVGSCRDRTVIGNNSPNYDSLKYCGYYTQEEIKEVVRYAADRYITVIPEIELPGHSSAALTAYPYLGCTGGPYQVAQRWGVFSDIFCAGNDSVFLFLQDVLDEVMALFPSKYIHIGGDESPKERWKVCPKCQRCIKENNLKDEHELQSYFIQRIEKYINSKGRQIIGWDEILEGGLAPNATVMSWRGEKGGIDAARQHHFVIMTPGNAVYFDHAQKKYDDSLTIGGSILPLETVYRYEPIPKELSEDDQHFVLGAQANLWTEYIANVPKLEYMLFPRLSALSEVLWSPRESRNWEDFSKRLLVQFSRYHLWKINYSKAYFDLKASILPADNNHGIMWKLETRTDSTTSLIRVSVENPDRKPITYAVEDTSIIPESKRIYKDVVTRDSVFSCTYLAPIHVEANTAYVAQLYQYDPSWRLNPNAISQTHQKFSLNKATGKKITLSKPPSDNFPGNGGAFGLINGALSEGGLSSPEWLGWQDADMEAVIDLTMNDTISEVNMHTLALARSRCYPPAYMEVFTSPDGIAFNSLGKTSLFIPDRDNMGNMALHFSPTVARFVKVLAKEFGPIPGGQPGAGNQARLLVDEIQIN